MTMQGQNTETTDKQPSLNNDIYKHWYHRLWGIFFSPIKTLRYVHDNPSLLMPHVLFIVFIGTYELIWIFNTPFYYRLAEVAAAYSRVNSTV